MRFATFSTDSISPRAGLVRGDQVVDISRSLARRGSSEYRRIDMLDLIRDADGLLGLAHELVHRDDVELADALLPLAKVHLLPPVARPPKNIMCLGRNYPEHASESARAFGDNAAPEARPDFPTIFTKAPTALVGPYDAILVDTAVSAAMDWEVELAVVIGKDGANIEVEQASDHVFGYTILNDVTARDLQRRYGGQFFKGKSLDASSPVGPWIVTPDELGPVDELTITLRVNDLVKQRDRVGSMVFSVPEIIAALSVGLKLEPGDIIATGTPGGVGFARDPKEFLRPGDVVECEISGIGTLRNRVTGPNRG
jgi:2-keto-4-pentenoate hydratase/2-oxohepta-3-ene-1,7-dioic acid hydratase in catechol pathway